MNYKKVFKNYLSLEGTIVIEEQPYIKLKVKINVVLKHVYIAGREDMSFFQYQSGVRFKGYCRVCRISKELKLLANCISLAII